MMSEFSKADAKAGACAYILHMLLQRLEATQPGIVEELLNGAKADQIAFNLQSSPSDAGSQTFGEAIAVLELIHSQNNMASQCGSK
jgi:hypothetical protein